MTTAAEAVQAYRASRAANVKMDETTLHKFSAQDVYDRAVIHLATQRSRSTIAGGVYDDACALIYRSITQCVMKCSAGIFLSDRVLSTVEGKHLRTATWAALYVLPETRKMMQQNGVPSPHPHEYLILSLQGAHDNTHGATLRYEPLFVTWRRNLQQVADRFNRRDPAIPIDTTLMHLAFDEWEAAYVD